MLSKIARLGKYIKSKFRKDSTKKKIEDEKFKIQFFEEAKKKREANRTKKLKKDIFKQINNINNTKPIKSYNNMSNNNLENTRKEKYSKIVLEIGIIFQIIKEVKNWQWFTNPTDDNDMKEIKTILLKLDENSFKMGTRKLSNIEYLEKLFEIKMHFIGLLPNIIEYCFSEKSRFIDLKNNNIYRGLFQKLFEKKSELSKNKLDKGTLKELFNILVQLRTLGEKTQPIIINYANKKINNKSIRKQIVVQNITNSYKPKKTLISRATGYAKRLYYGSNKIISKLKNFDDYYGYNIDYENYSINELKKRVKKYTTFSINEYDKLNDIILNIRQKWTWLNPKNKNESYYKQFNNLYEQLNSKFEELKTNIDRINNRNLLIILNQCNELKSIIINLLKLIIEQCNKENNNNKNLPEIIGNTESNSYFKWPDDENDKNDKITEHSIQYLNKNINQFHNIINLKPVESGISQSVGTTNNPRQLFPQSTLDVNKLSSENNDTPIPVPELAHWNSISNERKKRNWNALKIYKPIDFVHQSNPIPIDFTQINETQKTNIKKAFFSNYYYKKNPQFDKLKFADLSKVKIEDLYRYMELDSIENADQEHELRALKESILQQINSSSATTTTQNESKKQTNANQTVIPTNPSTSANSSATTTTQNESKKQTNANQTVIPTTSSASSSATTTTQIQPQHTNTTTIKKLKKKSIKKSIKKANKNEHVTNASGKNQIIGIRKKQTKLRKSTLITPSQPTEILIQESTESNVPKKTGLLDRLKQVGKIQSKD